jgi:acyl-CoA reductase-like NAD-dependent aldehyde dehydrogenase
VRRAPSTTIVSERNSLIGYYYDPFSQRTVRPISQTPGEIAGAISRCRHLIDIAKESLADVPQTGTDTEALRRYIRREPIGVVAVVAPWK